MSKWVIGMIVIVVLAFGTVIGFNLFVNKKIENTLANLPEPVYPVTIEKLTPTVWPQGISAIGFIEPNQGVDVSNEVAGIVTAINFDNGGSAKQGTVLLSLDASVQKADLKAQQVQLPSVRDDYNRLVKLYKERSVSEQSVETAQSKYQAMLANIESLQATIALREIKAPFNGLLGIRNVNLGQYVSVGTDIVRLEDLSVMRVRFSVPQAELGNISIGQAISLTVEAFPGRTYKGAINAIEPVVNNQTGLVMVQAELPNDDNSLRGGMFADVNIALSNLDNQFVVPQTAIVFALYGNSVYVVEKKDNETRVKQVTVEVTQRNGNDALVTGALKFDDEVVTTGILNLGNNAKVDIVPNPISVPDKMPQL
ncbi:efflux transporter periplasmic adaptor subunit [Enterovibrio norvegicus FF-33]|uniref:Efflux transporter periplasmic adaptor subunit n=1 Tax=Enterovibrio norvegicus FF-454 TaxID=1185651 RepID=A0A1E5BW36_9GAMM|nr:efflux RND transporter periplasmic adaptor subunit [Enterovibrio norvegicus]OEE57420.1 efflux transporter periplasmic adaptor subunit [Enterovibrio norvegicus FF-454]OEE67312.1 efflux transporter periplasmic adaptor subunit [Enterovibrio norvegicus FF-33]